MQARLIFSALILMLCAAACLPTAQPVLPTPQPHLTALSSPTALSTATLAPPDILPDPTPISGGDKSLPELARATYGRRLIDWVSIPALQLRAPVVPVGWEPVEKDWSNPASQWDSPNAEVGWAISSGLPGDENGNVVLYGHNNIDSSVFQRLYQLQPGDQITLTTGQRDWLYRVSAVTIFPVEPGAEKQAYASYLKMGHTSHLTLISCYPPTNNTHRVVVIANPAAQ